jgi:NADH dehydrogenase [ubiquinone] 1 alpha subcomplex assembly factor 8
MSRKSVLVGTAAIALSPFVAIIFDGGVTEKSAVADFGRMSANASNSPLKRFAVASVKTCGVQAAEYGQCVLRSYKDVHKDMCAKEFSVFKECLQTVVLISLSICYKMYQF